MEFMIGCNYGASNAGTERWRCYEPETVDVHLARTPVQVEKLMPDGAWKAVPFARLNDLQVRIEEPVRICDPLMLRLTF